MALGTYGLARRWLGGAAALLAAALFAFGGHVGGHVEQINQLQGLAWLPWAFLALDVGLRQWRWRGTLLLAGALALQILCGHTQTVFITAVGLGLYGVLAPQGASAEKAGLGGRARASGRRVLRLGVVLGLAGAAAGLLTLAQLWPTLELIGLSNRQGGLDPWAATAFSLSPLVLGRALLPNYDTPLFGEYIAYIGVGGLGLALIGVFGQPKTSAPPLARAAWGTLAVMGVLLALGAYTPLYWGLAGLPGFNFFRVPARWMALFALAGALLAGGGLQALRDGYRPPWRLLALIVALTLALAALAFLAPYAPEAGSVPGLSAPTAGALVLWGGALLLFVLTVLFLRADTPTRGLSPLRLSPVDRIKALALLEIVLAASAQPYNDLSARDVYDARRFSVSQIEALNADDMAAGRVLSIGDLLFDPGDRAALEARYAAWGLSPFAVRNAFVAIKLNEMLSPNQPLRWGIPTVDGFGGGLLPTAYYTAFATLLTPDGQPAPDGRLREALALPANCRAACIPQQRWLDLMGTRFLIVDKVYDLWHDGVAYDTTFEQRLESGATFAPVYSADFSANAVDALYAGEAAPELLLDGERIRGAPLRPLDAAAPSLEGFQIVRFTFAAPRRADFGQLVAVADTRIRALTLVDTRAPEVFEQVTLNGDWRMILSSDVRVYERVPAPARAFLVYEVRAAADDASALEMLGAPDFDPATTAILSAADVALAEMRPEDSDRVTITHYSAERVEIGVESAGAAYLLLSDAWYPGWQAAVNGEAAPLYRANVLLRAVPVPAGTSTVVFTFYPTMWPLALLISGGAWLVFSAMLAAGLRRR
ncbi:MAG: YfhO family protein [Chloroflexi bacterium]|nr:YfhO family protein [Chloroflexota bacterium]